jgi:hypothetical protein
VNRPVALLVLLVSVSLLTPAVLAESYEAPDSKHSVIQEDDPTAKRLQLKYPTYDGPVEPNENPYVIQQPLYPEQREAGYISSVADSRGLTSGAGPISPGAMSGPGAILVSPRGTEAARSTHQEARRSLKKLIRILD